MEYIYETDFKITKDMIFEDAKYDDTHQYPIYIILMHSGTPLANAIKKVTGDEYSHACISFNSGLSPLYSFGGKTKAGESGFGFVVQSSRDNFYKNRKSKFAVYTMFVSKEGRDAMKERLKYFQKNKEKLKYDIVGLIQIFFGKSTEYKMDKFFCSRFVMDLISKGSNIGDRVPSLWKPEDIKQLSNISLIQKGDDFYHYSKTKADKEIENIKKKCGYVEESTIVKNYMNKYLDAHPVYRKIISINEENNNTIGEYTPRCESDYTKIKNIVESCNKILYSSYNINIDYTPTTINDTGILFINKN